MYIKLFTVFIVLLCILTPGFIYSKSDNQSSHGDESKLLKGCGSCHKGHGVYNTPMLPERKDRFCFRCHGDSTSIDKAKQKGDLARNVREINIEKEFEKAHHHPIERTGIHRSGEFLPEINSSVPRHSECGDCHHHHYVSEKNKIAGIRGTNVSRAKVFVNLEYELCFNCHSYSANLPANQTNKALLFDTANPSYHPVIGPGKNIDMPSLMPPLTQTSLIKCTDCHGSEDPMGPKGPHGSSYRYILCKNFIDTDGQEGPFQYELCYSCHRRSSILGNESFLYHNLHISSVGVSCKTCHNPHGSTRTHLIDFDFNPDIRPSQSGRMDFIYLGSRAGQCFLNCHGKEHDPAMYPPGTIKKSSSQKSTRSTLHH